MSEQGADERRIRSLLVHMGVGPDAVPPTAPDEPEPPADDDPDAWWDELYADDEPERRPSPRLPNWWEKKPEHLAEQDDEQPEQDTEQTANTPANTPPTSPNNTPEHDDPAPAEQPQQRPARKPREHHSPRQSLLDAWDGIRPRTRWLVHHATAAAAGWSIGIVHWASNTAAWYAAGNWTAPSAWVLYGLGLGCIALYRRARTWVYPAAWAAAIPVSSITVGVLLYAPTQ